MNRSTAVAAVVAAVGLGLAGCSSTTTTPPAPTTTVTVAPSPTLPPISTAQMCTEHLDSLDSMLALLNKDLTLANADPAKVAAYKTEFTRLSQQAPPPADKAYGILADNMVIGGADKDAVANAGQPIVDMCVTYLASAKAARSSR